MFNFYGAGGYTHHCLRDSTGVSIYGEPPLQGTWQWTVVDCRVNEAHYSVWEAEGGVKQASDYIHCPETHKVPCHLKGGSNSSHRATECSGWAEKAAQLDSRG